MKWRGPCVALAIGVASAGGAVAADGAASRRTIGYVLSNLQDAVYKTPDGKKECPAGFNQGPRDQFKILFPDNGEKRSVVDTHLRREAAGWFPQASADSFPFLEVQGSISYGMNLDGKVGPNDFTGPDGEQGVKNQLYRAIGCIRTFREPLKWPLAVNYNRLMIELVGVKDLQSADDVEVTLYRGRDALLTDATGDKVMPGGTQRIDSRWGGRFITHLHGRIAHGVLTTEPMDAILPWARYYQVPGIYKMNGLQLRLKLTPDAAEGLIAGYADIDVWYDNWMRAASTHHQSYGNLSAPSLHQELVKLADGYPDPKTGANAAISAALAVSFVHVYIRHDSLHRPEDSKPPALRLPRRAG